MPTLFLKCRGCHEEFPTPIGISAEAMSGFIISGLTHRCPRCHAEFDYVTQDYHLPASVAAEPNESATALPVDATVDKANYEKVQADRYNPVPEVADVPAPSGRFEEIPVSQGE